MRDPTCVIVTEATGILARAVVARLAAQGTRLLCVDKSMEALNALVLSLPPEAEVLTFACADLADAVIAHTMVEAASDCFGGVDALVNTFGGFATGRTTTDTRTPWDPMTTLNARVALATSVAVLPVMQAAGYGRIVHTAAWPDLGSGPQLAAYAAAKTAVLRLTETIASEHRGDRITANCVLPGMIDAPHNRAATPDSKAMAWVSPDSIARLISFLISPEAAVVSGAAIPATGME